jgi:hypothetical protein
MTEPVVVRRRSPPEVARWVLDHIDDADIGVGGQVLVLRMALEELVAALTVAEVSGEHVE